MTFYENSVLYTEYPKHPSEQYYIFFDESEKEWVGIPKSSITEKELRLLNSLYELIKPSSQSFNETTRKWNDFLFLNGEAPTYRSQSYFRFIQFHVNGEGVEQTEIESAIKGFFSDEILFIWENDKNGIVIEERKQISLTENELVSISDTLESDLYVKISFYVGKLLPLTDQMAVHFQQEREYFTFAKKYLTSTNVITFERIFPSFAAAHLPDDIIKKAVKELLDVFTDDPELFSTIKVFLENNLNASLTAKKLYIHRNTLQYRIDKFVEKTGIQLKDFYGAFTVFLACLIFEKDNVHKK